MYSDMSKRIRAWSLANRKLASARASSVLPTPVGPRKTKLPTGRAGFFSPARERRIAREIAEIAFSWLMTRLCSSSSIRSSLSLSSWLIDAIGTPVHFETTSSISCLPTMTLRADDLTSNFSRENLQFVREKFDVKSSARKVIVGKQEIDEVVSKWTGVPIASINQDESDKLLRMELELHKRVISQEKAISAISRAIRRSRAGLKNPNRPVGSFVFLGPTGVGKTELARALANFLFASDHAL